MLHAKFLDRIGNVAVVSVIGLFLYPFMGAGFFFDDIYNSVTRGYLIANDMTLWGYTKTQMQIWVVDNGRLFPLSVIMGAWTWFYFDTLLSARSYQISMVVANIILWYSLIYKITSNKRLAILSILLLSCVIQFNPRWDGLSSFNALNQNVISFILLSALFLIFSIASTNNRRTIFFVVSLFFTCCALLTYEVGVLSILFNAALIYCHKGKYFSRHKALSCYIFLAVLYLALNLYLRIGRSASYDGTELEFGYKILLTFFRQFMSAFPFAFLSNDVMALPKLKYSIALVLFFSFLIVFYTVIRLKMDSSSAMHESASRYGLFGYDLSIIAALIFLVIPAALIALSARYQSIIKYGDPYIVVYVQCFGSSLMLAIVVEKLVCFYKGVRASIAISVFLALAASITVSFNFQRIDNQNKIFKDPRIVTEKLLKTSFMSHLPAGANLLVDSPAMWESLGEAPANLCSAFYSQHLNRKINCTGVNNFSLKNFGESNSLQEVFYLKISSFNERRVWELQGGGKRKHSQYSGKKISSVVINDVSKGVVFHQLGDGFYGWEIGNGESFAWARGTGRINIINLSEKLETNLIKFHLMSAVDQLLVIEINNIEFFRKYFKSGESAGVEFESPLKYGENILSILANGSVMHVNGDPRTFSFYVKSLEVNKPEIVE